MADDDNVLNGDGNADGMSWVFPLWIVGGKGGGSFLQLPVGPHKCCLVYRDRSLAETFIKEVFSRVTLTAVQIPTADNFRDGLKRALAQGTDHTLWDAPVHSDGTQPISLLPIEVVLASLNGEEA